MRLGPLVSGHKGLPRAVASRADRSPHTEIANGGEELYQASCVVCHGPWASGGIAPRLASNPILSNDQAFWKVVYEGRHVMPPLKGVITEEQMTDIRTWLQALR
jgi:mono/diheme cytochrome c family protein